jgi:riboflavin kinase/FMN adenylyltransferase
MTTLVKWQNVERKHSWLTIGVFDGVHRGHRAILEPLAAEAHAAGSPAVVVTFDPHPAEVFAGPQRNFLLTDLNERSQLLGELGVDDLIALPFDRAMADTPAAEFLQMLKERLDFVQLWVGHDFALGHNREGNLAYLANAAHEFGYDFRAFPPISDEGGVISSTRIRELLLAGDLVQANGLLGREYSLSGQVVPGDGRGRTIGVPTANININPARLAPANGVYACQVQVGDKWQAAAVNIGVRPTFTEGETAARIEAHLLDFDSDLYGQTLRLAFQARLRPEQKFDGIDALVAQIQADIARAREILSN